MAMQGQPSWPPSPPNTTLPVASAIALKALKITKHEFKKLPDKTATFYTIEVETISDARYVLERRFAHLKLLHEWITEQLPHVKLPQLPPKAKTFFQSAQKEAKRRRKILQQMLDHITSSAELCASLFVVSFFSNTPEVDPAELRPENTGLLYINVCEIAGVAPATKARVELLSNFHVRSPRCVATVGPPQAPSAKGHAIFQELAMSVTVRAVSCVHIILLASTSGQPIGARLEFLVSSLQPYRMYDVWLPCKGTLSGASVHLMVQFNPLAIAKPFLIALDAWRFQVHRRAQLRAGGVLWGAFVYSNRAPLRVDSVNIELMCTQDVAINTKEGDQLVGVQTVATIVQSSRQTYHAPYGDDVLKPGFYVFPFEFLIPIDSPSSIQYNSAAGSAGCRWKIKATVGPAKYNLPLLVQGTLPLDEQSGSGTFTLAHGGVTFSATLDSTIFNLHEPRKLDIEFQNSGPAKVYGIKVVAQAFGTLYQSADAPSGTELDSAATLLATELLNPPVASGTTRTVNLHIIPTNQNIDCTIKRDASSPLLETAIYVSLKSGKWESLPAKWIPVRVGNQFFDPLAPPLSKLYPTELGQESDVKVDGAGLPFLPIEYLRPYPSQSPANLPLFAPYSVIFSHLPPENYPLLSETDHVRTPPLFSDVPVSDGAAVESEAALQSRLSVRKASVALQLKSRVSTAVPVESRIVSPVLPEVIGSHDPSEESPMTRTALGADVATVEGEEISIPSTVLLDVSLISPPLGETVFNVEGEEHEEEDDNEGTSMPSDEVDPAPATTAVLESNHNLANDDSSNDCGSIETPGIDLLKADGNPTDGVARINAANVGTLGATDNSTGDNDDDW